MTAREQLSEPNPQYTEIDGVTLAYHDAGSGQTLLCLHAVGHGSRDFEMLRERVGDQCRMITLDWPGHGCSGDDEQPASAGRYAELLATFIDQQELRRPVIVGNSIGGAASILYASKQPESVAGLVICDAGGLVPPNGATRFFCNAMAAAYRRGQGGARWFSTFYSTQYRVLLRGSAADDHRRRIVAAGRDMSRVLEQAWQSFAGEDADIRELVTDVTAPVLLAWARSDPYNSYKLARPALAEFTRAETRLFPGAHAPFLEQPDTFASALMEFLDSLPADANLDHSAAISAAG